MSRYPIIKLLYTCSVILVMAASGCITSDEPEVASDINIVLVLPLTGSFRDRGEVHKTAVQMAFRDLTEQGELLPDRTLRVWLVDSTADADEAERRVRELVDELFRGPGGTHYVAGIISSSEPAQIAALRVALELEVPHFEVSSGVRWDEFIDSGDPRAHKLAFTAQATNLAEAIYAADYIKSRDVWEKLLIMRGNNAADRTQTQLIRSRLAASGWSGTILNAQDIVMDYNTDWRDYLAGIDMPTRPDVIYFKLSGDTNVRDFLSDAKLLDIFPNLVTSGATLDEQLLDAVNPGIIDFLDANFSVAARTPISPELGNQYLDAFRTDFTAYLADTQTPGSYELWAPAAYDAAMAMGLGIAAAGTTNGNEVADAIEQISKEGETVGYGEAARALQLVRQGMDINYEGASGSFDIRNDSIDGSTRDTARAVPGELHIYETRYADGTKGEYVSLDDPDPVIF